MTTQNQDQADLEQQDSQETPSEPDYKALYEETKTKVDSLEHQLKDTKAGYPGALKQNARDEHLVSLHNEVSTLRETLGVLADKLFSDEEESSPYRTRYHNLQTQSAQQEWASWHNDRLEQLRNLVAGEEGPIMDINSDPELEPVRQRWADAQQRQDRAGIAEALSDAKDVIYVRRQTLGQQNGTDNTNGNHESNNGANDQDEDYLASMDSGPTSSGRGSYGSMEKVREAFILGQIDTKKYDELRRQFNR